MSKIDISTLSITEIEDLISKSKTTIEQKKKSEKKAVLAEIKALAQSRGFDLKELISLNAGADKPVKKSVVAPKYQDPANASNLWSGRGKQPVWFKKAIEGGAKAEQLLCK